MSNKDNAERFRLQLAEINGQIGAQADGFTRKVILDVATALVMRTPVGDPSLWQSPPPKGYTGGRARGSWQHGAGSAPTAEVDEIDPSGEASIERIGASVPEKPFGQNHFVVNGLPYIERLEDGWSSQAPAGMVAVTVVEWQGIVDRAAEAVRGAQ